MKHRHMKHCCALVLALSSLAIPTTAHEAKVAGFGSLSPDAPPETAQFGFLVGAWSCTTRNMRPDGSLHDGPNATWTGYYILDGWAIADDWISELPDGGTYHGTNIRSFNRETGKWDNRWLSEGSLRWKYFEAEQVGDTMVMTGGEGVDAQGRKLVDRNTFYEISKSSWKWRKDRSFDGGETYIQGVGHIHCQLSDQAEKTPASPKSSEGH